MKYYYCERCGRARPKTLMLPSRCEICGDACTIIEVRRSVFGYLMYAVDILAALIIVLYVAHNDFGSSFTAFMGEIDGTLLMGVLFGLIAFSFVLGFIDIGRTNRKVQQVINARSGRVQ